MGFSKIKGKLISRIGRPVSFSPPLDVRHKGGDIGRGEIIDEVWEDDRVPMSRPRRGKSKSDWGDYAFCAQLIRWEDGDTMIRLAYYRRRVGEDHWEFASQMTVCSYPAVIRRLLKKTLAKRAWFK